MTTLSKALVAGALGALMWTGMAQAQVQTPGWFGEVNGMYAGTSNGSAINSNNVGSSTPGSGAAGNIRLGYRFNSPWDLAIGAFYAKFKDGPHIEPPPANEWSVTGASIFNLDGEAGYNMGFAWGGLRPFFGVRYQQVQHQMGYHPDSPLGCCENSTTTNGFGPRIGFDGSYRLTGPLSLIGGADFAVLFGRAVENGMAGTVANGSADRTIYNYGGHIGLDWEVMPLWHIAAGYRVEATSGSFFTDEGFTPTGLPSGSGNRIVQGPFAGVRYNFGGTPH